MSQALMSLMKQAGCHPSFLLTRFKDSCPVEVYRSVMSFDEEGNGFLQTRDTLWSIRYRDHRAAFDGLSLRFDFRLEKGVEKQASMGIGLSFSRWHPENYVLMPAAAYAGNRFPSIRLPYPPQLDGEEWIRKDIPLTISDIPRLNIGEGPSRIQQLSRDMSTPGIGMYDPVMNRGFFLLTSQETSLGDSMISIEEHAHRTQATIDVTAPGVRHRTCYRICDNMVPSPDRGHDFHTGDSFTLSMQVHAFDCLNLQGLFYRFTGIRKDVSVETSPVHLLPFHACFQIQADKYNKMNWVEEKGYYSVGMRETIYADWQTGWVGGLMVTHPLLMDGDSKTRNRALRNIDFAFQGGQSPSGFFYGCFHLGRWYGDRFRNPESSWHLVRKSADALYFLLKQFMMLDSCHAEFRFPKHWLEGLERLADAFVRLWERYNEFGQYIDTETGDLLIRNSASGSIAMAGLALCADFLDRPGYLALAEEAAFAYYRRFTQAGYTCGGPGEILQCPDSESAFGLLESLVVLYEVTRDPRWLARAKEQADQCFTWCVSYDFRFPENSTFGKLRMQTLGTVYASVQNKHSAPGICTLSGDSLFKLYRYTGEIRYLHLIREIAHSLPQYLSREDRPISGMPPGWMNERVEMSDWNEPVGEIFYGSCWSEVSSMLTYTEIPGVYVQTDTGFLCVFDHVEARILEKSDSRLIMEIHNPTGFDTRVKVFHESSRDMTRILGQNAMISSLRIHVPAGGTERVVMEPPGSLPETPSGTYPG